MRTTRRPSRPLPALLGAVVIAGLVAACSPPDETHEVGPQVAPEAGALPVTLEQVYAPVTVENGTDLKLRKRLAARAFARTAAYDAAVADPATAERVELDFEEGQALGVSSTPTFFLEGEQLQLQQLDDLENAIQAAVNGGQ